MSKNFVTSCSIKVVFLIAVFIVHNRIENWFKIMKKLIKLIRRVARDL